jgi:hypothetical protein
MSSCELFELSWLISTSSYYIVSNESVLYLVVFETNVLLRS